MLCKVLGMLATSLADLSMLLQGPKSPTSKRNPPTCCLISCEVKGVAYHQVSYMEAWWYTTPLAGIGTYYLEDLDEKTILHPWNVNNLKRYYY